MFTNEFISLCQEYAQKNPQVIFQSVDDSKKCCKYTIEFYSYILEFRYIKKESAYVKPSSLYCVLKLRKNSAIHYHLTDIIPFLEKKNFNSCYFWHIETAERMNACFKSLENTLDNIISQITPFLSDDDFLEKSLFENYKTIYNLKDNDIDFTKVNDESDFSNSYFLSLQKMRDEYIFSRYSNFAPYAFLLKNKVDKALEKYEKLNQKGRLLEYEKALINYIVNLQSSEFNAFDSDCDTSACETLQSPWKGIKEFILCFIVFSIFFCGLFYVFNLIQSIGAVVILSAPWYIGCLCAGFCSVFGAIALSVYRPTSKYLSKEESRNFSNVIVSKGIKRLSFIVFLLSIAVSIFFAVMIMISNARFYEDDIRFENKSYSYTQIDSVYYIEARYNEYGKRIERGSYVILFDDKTSLDLDGYTSVKFTEKEVLPLLKRKGFDVNFADSEKDLPWY